MSGLVVREVTAGYGSLRVLTGISLDVAPATITLLTGPNGAGKTTLLRAILGAINLTSGSVHLDGQDLATLQPAERLRGPLGWAPEGRALFGDLTVRENLRVAARTWGVNARDTTTRIDDLADRFPIVAAKLDAPVRTLSGGQQQAVAVARAILGRPKVLLLDEPSTGLAPIAWQGILETCRAAADAGASVLIVEQRLLDALAAVDRVAVLVGGRIVREGRADDPELTDEVVRDEYFSRGPTP